MSIFTLDSGESVLLEGKTTYLKTRFRVSPGYALLTSRRLVFFKPKRYLFNEIGDDLSKGKVEIELDLKDITTVEQAPHGLAQKVTVSTADGNQWDFQFKPRDTWIDALRHPETVSPATVPENAANPSALKGYATVSDGAINAVCRCRNLDEATPVLALKRRRFGFLASWGPLVGIGAALLAVLTNGVWLLCIAAYHLEDILNPKHQCNQCNRVIPPNQFRNVT